jgi:hypothetical protein
MDDLCDEFVVASFLDPCKTFRNSSAANSPMTSRPPRLRIFFLASFLALSGFSGFFKAEGQTSNSPLREELCLNGEWDFTVDGGSSPSKVRIPGSYAGLRQVGGQHYVDVWDYPSEWKGKGGTYRRIFDLPPGMRGRRVSLWCGGGRFVTTVKVNGREAGTHEGSETPFEFDVTEFLGAGPNTIEIRTDPKPLDSEDVNSNRRGIWGDLFLRSYGDLRVTDESVVITSVEHGTITCRADVRNEGKDAENFSLNCEVLDADGKTVRKFSGGNGTLQSGISGVFEASSPWENPRFWSPDDPYLYRLRVTLLDPSGKPLDEWTTRFGFREISVKGSKMLLNGRELLLRGTGDHTEGDIESSPEYLRLWIRELKKEGLCFMRLHTMVKSAYVFDVADEEGFFLEAEAPHHFRLPSPERGALNVERLVKAYRNHPSVLVWSVANELHWKGIPEPGALIDVCRRLDPTRPAFASDFSGWSVLGDVLGHHYNTFQVFDEWEKFGPGKPMIWDEFGWIWPMDRPVTTGPSGYEYCSQDRSGAGLWNDAAEQIRAGIEFFEGGRDFAGSIHRISVWCPWDYSQNFHRYQPFNNFQPLRPDDASVDGRPGLYPKVIKPGSTFVNVWDRTLPKWEPNPGYDVIAPLLRNVRYADKESRETALFGGAELLRHTAVAYDDLRSCHEIACLVESTDGKRLSEQKFPLRLSPGDRKGDLALRWTLPKVTEPTPVRVVRECRSGGNPGYRWVEEATLFPQLRPGLVPSLAGRKLSVEDPALASWLQEHGFVLSTPAEAEILICNSEKPGMLDFVLHGGRVLRIMAPGGAKDAGYRILGAFRAMAKGIAEGTAIPPSGVLPLGADFTLHSGGSGTNVVASVLRAPMESLNTLSFASHIVMGAAGEGAYLYADLLREGNPALLSGNNRLELAVGALPFHPKAKPSAGMSVPSLRLVPVLRTGRDDWYAASPEDGKLLGEIENKEGVKSLNVSWDLRTLHWHRIPSPKVAPEAPMPLQGAPTPPDFSSVTSVGVTLAGGISPGDQVRLLELVATGDAAPAAHIPLNGAPHRLLSGLGQEQFTFWRGGSSSAILPVSAGGGNVRVVLQGDKDGNGAALTEFPAGDGDLLVSCLRLAGNLDREPAAQWALRNMLEYLASYRPAEGNGATGIAAGSGWRDFLKGLGLVATPLPETGEWKLAGIGRVILDFGTPWIVEACRHNAERLKEFVNGGGMVFVVGTDGQGIELLRSLTGSPLKLTDPFLGVRDTCIKAPVSWTRRSTPPIQLEVYDGIMTRQSFEANYDPLISGIANRSLEWGGKQMFSQGIEIAGMDPVMASPDHSILISNWKVSLEQPFNSLFREYIHAVHDMRQNSWFVNRDPVLLRVNTGKGSWILCQLNLPSGGESGRLLATQILTNLRAPIGQRTRFQEDDRTFDPEPNREQLRRFAAMSGEVAPGRRQYYGTPDPLPDYFRNTFADKQRAGGSGQPSTLLLGDTLLLQAAPGIAEELGGRYRIETHPKPLGNNSEVTEALPGILPGHHWNTILLVSGTGDIRAVGGKPLPGVQEFEAALEKNLSSLKGSADKIYWASIVPMPRQETDAAQEEAAAAAYNAAAERVCKKLDVYYVNLGQILEQAAPGYAKRPGRKLTPEEAKEAGRKIASALKFLG